MNYFLQLVLTGLMVGSIYALISLGFVVIYKSSGIFNLAQGEFMLIGTYLCWSFIQQVGLPLWSAILVSVLIAAGIGFGFERFPIRPMIGQPILAIVMVTFAIGFFLKGLTVGLWGGERQVYPPYFPEEPLQLGNLVLSQEYACVFMISMLLFLAFVLFFRHTKIGLDMRATADDQQAAQSMGIRVTRVVGISWAISAMVCTIGGFLLGNINGIDIHITSLALFVFCAVLVGGLDSIPGAIIGGLLVGIMESLGTAYVGHGFGLIGALLVLVLVLLVRPFGIFGLERIERL